ncbi:CRISPR-associated helicase Cas3' [Ectothiorhodospiraceae bacterium BW-2]|nr:CRISPR-associated helicase Cas3' [Ectothiorhodospiraceae bacterium BW-2]
MGKLESIAHVRCDDSETVIKPHALKEHLIETAKLAAEVSTPFQAQAWAELAGRWHDLGKYRQRFQDYIRLQTGYEAESAHLEHINKAPHSTVGAIHAIKQQGDSLGHILAYLIAGHHAGLPDWHGGKASLGYRLKQGQQEYQEAMRADIPADILSGIELSLPQFTNSSKSIWSLWMRLLFSALVDADFLDTERYMSPERASKRDTWPSLEELRGRFDTSIAELQAKQGDSPLASIRSQIYQQCLVAANWEPGLFSLTVPTGGGKTLSSLAFALQHAKKYYKRRIIYAIPFTSIIEQNADVFRRYLGDDAVLEHHSNLDLPLSEEGGRSRLAAENWDAPLIVTTNVQLFESLHASRTSRCRKLHNLVNSIIILDEVQQLPRDFHAPITTVMQQLADDFGVSWVLCTATQPELGRQQNSFGQTLLEGLSNVREIINAPSELANQLQRVIIQLPQPDAKRQSWQGIAEVLIAEPLVLAVVNRRDDARTLFELLPDEGQKYHLSAQMCPEHRSVILGEIKKSLLNWKQDDPPLRVVTTQLIEAGVDIDFPVVYRAMAGLDSIAQAAGRCNREAKLPQPGRVVVFLPPTAAPMGLLKQGEEVTIELLQSGKLTNPLAPESFSAYFDLLNSKGERDKQGILKLLTPEHSQDAPLAIAFRTAAEKFRLIDNEGESVIVPYRSDKKESPVYQWLSLLEQDSSQKWIYRKLQRYSVTLPQKWVQRLMDDNVIEVMAGQRLLLAEYYDISWGVNLGDLQLSAEESII